MTDAERISRARLEKLIESKATFLRFLEKRVARPADAEDILQSALVEVVENPEALRDEERLYGWFYRVLRNRITDHYRRTAARDRAHRAAAGRSEEATPPKDELFDATCRCVRDVIDTLKPEQSRILRSAYVDDRPLETIAVELETNRNNAGVKLHRARQALKDALVTVCRSCAAHGCLDCTCRKGRPLPEPV